MKQLIIKKNRETIINKGNGFYKDNTEKLTDYAKNKYR